MFGWLFGTKEKKFNVEQVNDLVNKIKDFNAGAIDDHLSKYVEEVFEKWLEENKEN